MLPAWLGMAMALTIGGAQAKADSGSMQSALSDRSLPGRWQYAAVGALHLGRRCAGARIRVLFGAVSHFMGQQALEIRRAIRRFQLCERGLQERGVPEGGHFAFGRLGERGQGRGDGRVRDVPQCGCHAGSAAVRTTAAKA